MTSSILPSLSQGYDQDITNVAKQKVIRENNDRTIMKMAGKKMK